MFPGSFETSIRDHEVIDDPAPRPHNYAKWVRAIPIEERQDDGAFRAESHFAMTNLASSLPSASGIFLGGFETFGDAVSLPLELEEALAEDVYLPADFKQLTRLQRSSYAEWVAEGGTYDVRRERARFVCSITRVLAS